MPNIGIWDWVIIAAIFLLFFGAKRLPELAKGIGKSIHSFKQGLKEIEEDVKKENDDKIS